MRVTIRAGDPRPIYVQIMDEVRRALVVGSLRPDDSLPSIRELASELRVNPNTVSQAYRELERNGLVYTLRGRGTFVAPGFEPDGRERHALARDVANRALVDAHRNGVGLTELLDALREIGEAPPDGVSSDSPDTEASPASASATESATTKERS